MEGGVTLSVLLSRYSNPYAQRSWAQPSYYNHTYHKLRWANIYSYADGVHTQGNIHTYLIPIPSSMNPHAHNSDRCRARLVVLCRSGVAWVVSPLCQAPFCVPRLCIP